MELGLLIVKPSRNEKNCQQHEEQRRHAAQRGNTNGGGVETAGVPL